MPAASTTLPANGEAPGVARRALSELITDAFPAGLAMDAELLTSEIVTNSVRHAGLAEEDRIVIDLDLSEDRLRVCVSDEGPGFEYGTPQAREIGGWGLVLVDRLADRWGIVRNDPNRVWFELNTRTS